MKPVYMKLSAHFLLFFLSQVESLLCVPITGNGLDSLLGYSLQSGYLLPVIGPYLRQNPPFFLMSPKLFYHFFFNHKDLHTKYVYYISKGVLISPQLYSENLIWNVTLEFTVCSI